MSQREMQMGGKGFELPMSRRRFVRLSAASAASALLFGGIAGCAPAAKTEGKLTETGTYQAGTYTAAAEGKSGPVKVSVTLSDTAIEAIEVTDHHETRYISDVALTELPQTIIDFQSLGVDTVTGATLSSMAVLSAVGDCVSQAGGDPETLKAAAGPEKSTDIVDLTADVVIAGAGASGMAAAIAAVQCGAEKVVVLEKTSNIGGNCLVSGGYLEYVYPPEEYKEEMNDEYRTYFQECLRDALNGGADPKFVENLQKDFDAYYAAGNTKVYDSTGLYNIELCATESAGDCSSLTADTPINDPSDEGVQLNEWLTELGLEWKTPLHAIVGYTWPRWSAPTTGKGGQGYFDLFSARMNDEKMPIEVITLTPATELIMDGAKVVGLTGVCDDGTTYHVRGTKGVILATGGYSGNPDMLKQYNEFWEWDENTVIPTTNAAGHTGDGIEMAKAAGGFAIGMENPMLFPHADAKNYSTETTVGGLSMGVNSDGKRFVDEMADRYTISAAVLKQPGQIHYLISDVNSSRIENGKTSLGEDAEFLIERGQLYRADTLDELAEMAGINATNLKESVAKYNTAVETSTDEEFGRTIFAGKVEEPPFYASPRTVAAHITLGGIVVDDNYRAITQEGEIIEGLQVVGECVAFQCGVYSLAMGLEAARKLFV